ANAGRVARSPPAAAPRSSAPHRIRQYRASGCRSSHGAERTKSSSEAFLWTNLQVSLLVIPGRSIAPGDVIHVHCLLIMGQNDRRSPTMNPAFLPRALTAGLLALVAVLTSARAETLDKVSFGTNWV